jgi:hypothetical protein
MAILFCCNNLNEDTLSIVRINKNDNIKILILGNSITGAPSLEKDWTAGWGLASSTPENDYVHILHNKLSEYLGYKPYFKTFGVADFECNFNNYDLNKLAFIDTIHPDIILLRIGDNIKLDYAINHKLWNYFEKMIDYLRSRSDLVLCSSCWIESKSVDDIMKACCNKYNASFIDISYLSSRPYAQALSERPDIAWEVGTHPGDRGMEDIADVIFKGLIKHFE